MRLKGKTAFITGASVGIGSAIARRFSEEGCSLYLAGGRNQTALESTLAYSKAQGISVAGEGIDLSNLANLAPLMTRALRHLGNLDILVNCAGIRCNKPVEEITTEEVVALFQVNAMASFILSGLAAKHMNPRGGGQIINIGSTSGEAGVPNNSLYCATKGAMHLMTKAHAAELGPKGIRVNAIAPGTTLSEGTKHRVETQADRREKLISNIPLGRFATPEEIADCAVFMASDEASYMNGAVMLIDGGRLCQ
ncbi:MAG: SDR family oxidoreductase [Nitrospinae bacterium]|nr:SDR family oxidoreductase [Nitrospinota bacterium]